MLIQLDESPILGVSGIRFHSYSISNTYSCYSVANSEDFDKAPRSAAPDLGLHCLPMSQKWDARLIWVKLIWVEVSVYFVLF